MKLWVKISRSPSPAHRWLSSLGTSLPRPPAPSPVSQKVVFFFSPQLTIMFLYLILLRLLVSPCGATSELRFRAPSNLKRVTAGRNSECHCWHIPHPFFYGVSPLPSSPLFLDTWLILTAYIGCFIWKRIRRLNLNDLEFLSVLSFITGRQFWTFFKVTRPNSAVCNELMIRSCHWSIMHSLITAAAPKQKLLERCFFMNRTITNFSSNRGGASSHSPHATSTECVWERECVRERMCVWERECVWENVCVWERDRECV